MPKSKRAKVVHLTKVTKKTKAVKAEALDKIRNVVGQKRFCHVVEIQNPDSKNLQAVREALKPGKLLCHRNRVLQTALGTCRETSAASNVYKLSGLLTHFAKLVVSDESREEVQAKLDQFVTSKFPHSGDIASETVTLTAGREQLAQFPGSMEPMLRSLGLPTSLENGKIILKGDFVVCRAGEKLSSQSAKILKHLDYKMGVFRAVVKASWSAETGNIWLNRE